MNKIKRSIIKFLLPTLVVGLGAAPIVPDGSSAWVYSYGTMQFDTPSGELRKGEYGVTDGGQVFVNTKNGLLDVTDDLDFNPDMFRRVDFVGTQYIDQFADGSKKPATETEYRQLERNIRKPEKTRRRSVLGAISANAAIASATSTQVDSSGYVNSITFAISCSGTDRGLSVWVANRVLSEITGITHNSNAMTQEVQLNNVNVAGVRGYSLIAPDTGSQNIVVSLSQFRLSSVYANCLTGVDQTDMVEATSTPSTGFGTSVTDSITTITDGAWIMTGINLQNAYALTPDSGETELNDTDHSDSNLGQFGVSYFEKTTAGSETMGWSWSTSDNHALALLAVKPASGGGGGGGETTTRRFIIID